MDFSVIIRTKNSEKTIENCLRSLNNQIVKPKEIIIVDSGSTDLTIQKVKKYNVKVIFYPKDKIFNYSKAINIGINKTNSEFILILSSHVEFLNKQTVLLMKELLIKNSKCISVSIDRTENKKENLINDKTNHKKTIITKENFKGKAMYNFCSMIRKISWDEYHFNERIPRCEDQDWAFNFLKKGFFTGIILEPKVYYKNPYYNISKEALEYITIGKTVYPYFISKKFMISKMHLGVKNIISGNKKNAKYNLVIFWNIFKYKYFGWYNNESKYNKDL